MWHIADEFLPIEILEPKAFDGFMAHYGKFSGVTNYIAMIGKKGTDLEVVKADGEILDWFRHGVESALLAPTAMNQQKLSAHIPKY